MLFTVELVSCLGACSLAPVLNVDGVVYGKMTPEKTTTLINKIKGGRTLMKINSISEFNEVYEELRDSLEKQTKKIIVCGGTGCVAGGALKIFDELNRLLTENNIAGEVNLDKKDDNISLKKSGCPGLCEAGPLVRVEPDNILYTKVKVEDCEEIIKETYINKKNL